MSQEISCDHVEFGRFLKPLGCEIRATVAPDIHQHFFRTYRSVILKNEKYNPNTIPMTAPTTRHPPMFSLPGSVFLFFSHSTYFPDVSGLNSFSILAPAPNLNAARFCSNSWALICFRFWERPKFNAAQMCFPFRRPYLFSDFLDGHQLHKQMVVSVLHHVEF